MQIDYIIYYLNINCLFKDLKPTPTAKLDRTNDSVYEATTNVVRAVMQLSQTVQQHQVSGYLDQVTKVGTELRQLLASVDRLVHAFPESTHKQAYSYPVFFSYKSFKASMHTFFLGRNGP